MSRNLLNSLLGSKVSRMPFRPAHGSYLNFVEDSTTVQNVSRDSKHLNMPSMCQGLIRISHNSRVSTGATTIRTKIKAKGGVIIRIIRAIRVMDGGTIRATCHHPEPPTEKKVDLEQDLAQCSPHIPSS